MDVVRMDMKAVIVTQKAAKNIRYKQLISSGRSAKDEASRQEKKRIKTGHNNKESPRNQSAYTWQLLCT